MTITAADSRIQYTASASQTQFTLPFEFEADADLAVYLTPVGQTPDPTTDILSLNNDYTVTGSGWGTPTLPRYITLVVAATLNDTITILRDMPLSRTTDFAVSGDFSAEDLNDQFDDVVAMVQQVNTKLERLGLLYADNQILDQSALSLQNTLPLLADSSSGVIPIWSTNSSGTLVATSITEDSGCSTLRTDLANDTNGADGARLSGYYNAALSPANTTVKAGLDHVIGVGPVTFGTIGQVVQGYFPSLSGWLEMDDGNIGSATSGATTRANADVETLFLLLWNNVIDAWCPVSTGRGGSAAADWAANKTIDLPKVLGRTVGTYGLPALTGTLTVPGFPTATLTLDSTTHITSGMKCQLTTTGGLPTGLLAATDYWITVLSGTTFSVSTSEVLYAAGTYITATSAGTGTHTLTVSSSTRAMGEYLGYEDHVLTAAEMSAHTHPVSPANIIQGGNTLFNAQNGPSNIFTKLATSTTALSTTANVSLNTAVNLVTPVAYMKSFIKYS